jgi:hypothetical protein
LDAALLFNFPTSYVRQHCDDTGSFIHVPGLEGWIGRTREQRRLTVDAEADTHHWSRTGCQSGSGLSLTGIWPAGRGGDERRRSKGKAFNAAGRPLRRQREPGRCSAGHAFR